MLKVIEINHADSHRPAFNALLVSGTKLIALAKLDGFEIRGTAPLNGASLVFEVSKDPLNNGEWIELTPLPNGRAMKTRLDVKRILYWEPTAVA